MVHNKHLLLLNICYVQIKSNLLTFKHKILKKGVSSYMTSSSADVTSIVRTIEDVEYTKIWLDFWSKVINSLAWPLFLSIAALIIFINRKKLREFIPEISRLLSRTKSVKLGSASISFSENLAKIEEEKIDSIDEDTRHYKVSEEGLSYITYYPNFGDIIPDWFSPKSAFNKLALLRPDFAILDSWQSLERLLYSGLITNRSKSFTVYNILSDLISNEKITKKQFNFIKDLYTLRNQVVHNSNTQLSYSDAEIYRKNCMEAFEILIESIN